LLHALVRKAARMLDAAESVGVVADIDADGVSGAATLCEAFHLESGDVRFPPGGYYGVPEDLLREMLEGYDVIVAVDVTPPPMDGAERRVIVIDHHPGPRRYPLTINPHHVPALPRETSASALAGMLAHRTGRLRRPWIPLVGAAGDGLDRGPVYETLARLVDRSLLVPPPGRRLNPIQDAAATVNAARRVRYHEGAERALEVLLMADSPHEVVESSLSRYRGRVRAERGTWSDRAARAAHVVLGVGYAEVHSEVDIEGLVAHDLLRRRGLRCAVVYNSERKPCGLLKASGRARGFPVNELLAEMARWLEGARAGGHPNAAALHFRSGDPREAFHRAADELLSREPTAPSRR
jgi:single-stranded DNA-specific DHH superfamily exonuclease